MLNVRRLSGLTGRHVNGCLKQVMAATCVFGLALLLGSTGAAVAQPRTFKVDVTKGVEEPLPFAAPIFVAEGPTAQRVAGELTQVVVDNLLSTGLFREIPREAHISRLQSFNEAPKFADWNAINAQALLTGSVDVANDGSLVVAFRLWDVVAGTPIGDGLRFQASANALRRIGHKVADAAYSRLTGEEGYFDSRVVFVSESGPKGARKKRLAVMDQDGENLRYLTGDDALVLAPRFSPTARDILYTSYQSGSPQVYLMNVDSTKSQALGNLGSMSFAPRFSPDGKSVILSATERGNTDLYKVDVSSRSRRKLTTSTAIDTAPSFSPDGAEIVFESDRGGTQQLYIMPASGGEAKRISFGDGRYGTPVWSPRGDLIAFTKMVKGRFHIGVMRTDGTQERLLTASFLDEGPTWAPNGRVLMFFRESRGVDGAPQLYSVDVSGRNLRRVKTPGFASDPAWSKVLP